VQYKNKEKAAYDYTTPGNNPFFLSYQEGPAVTGTRFTPVRMKASPEKAYNLLKKISPGMTLYQRDWAWAILTRKGILGKLDDPNIEKIIREAIQEVHVKTARVLENLHKKEEN